MTDLTTADDEVAKKILEIVAEQSMVDKSEITLQSTPEELGIDSLGLVEIVFAIEENFNVSVPYNANDPSTSDFDLSSVNAVVEAVRRLIAEQGASSA